MFKAGLEELFAEASLAEGRSDAVADVAADVPKVIVEFVSDAAAPYDGSIEEAVEHGVGDTVGFEVPAMEVIGESLQVGFVSHALGPDEGMPVRFFTGPCFQSGEKSRFVVRAELADLQGLHFIQ